MFQVNLQTAAVCCGPESENVEGCVRPADHSHFGVTLVTPLLLSDRDEQNRTRPRWRHKRKRAHLGSTAAVVLPEMTSQSAVSDR